jgi:trans-aconitate 2-methyltransferase
VADPWDPRQYDRFRAEREQPFHDLAALLKPRPAPRLADLGCGTGALTVKLHRAMGARETLGIDSSASMLADAPQEPGVRFEQQDIASFAPRERFDIIFSNAALHWLPDHGHLLARLRAALAPGGQLAVQVPANDEHPAHQTARALAMEHEFKRHLDGFSGRPPLPSPVQYAGWLHHLGFSAQHVRLQVYTHLLDSRDEVVQWVLGTLLTDYQRRLPPEIWSRYLRRYRELLLPRLPDERPFLFTYPRILFWGELPA